MDSGQLVGSVVRQLRCCQQDFGLPWHQDFLRTLSSTTVAGEQIGESAWLSTSGPSVGERPLLGSSIVAGLTEAFVAVKLWHQSYRLFKQLRLVFP